MKEPGKVGELGTVRAERGTDRLLALSVGVDIAESVEMSEDMTSGEAGGIRMRFEERRSGTAVECGREWRFIKS